MSAIESYRLQAWLYRMIIVVTLLFLGVWVAGLVAGVSLPWAVGAATVSLVGEGILSWRRGRMDRFVDICGVGDVADKKGLGLTVDGLGIAVFRDGENFHALLGRCPHADAPMGKGWVDGDEAVCPIHQWRFKLATGRCTTLPGRSIHKFRCKVIDGRVWVEV